MPNKVNEIAETIMQIALDNQDEWMPAAEQLVQGCIALGWNIEKTFAFLLTAAVDAHIELAQKYNKGDFLANALDALTWALGTSADAIREAINYELPTAEAIQEATAAVDAYIESDQVVQLIRPEAMSVETFDAIAMFLSKRFPDIAFMVSSTRCSSTPFNFFQPQ